MHGCEHTLSRQSAESTAGDRLSANKNCDFTIGVTKIHKIAYRVLGYRWPSFHQIPNSQHVSLGSGCLINTATAIVSYCHLLPSVEFLSIERAANFLKIVVMAPSVALALRGRLGSFSIYCATVNTKMRWTDSCPFFFETWYY